MTRFFLAALAAFAVLACGPSQDAPDAPAPAPISVSAASAAGAALTPQEITRRVAALPAPLNAANYQNGLRTFAHCRSCHQITAGAGNRVGPNLHGVYGARAAQVRGFGYSQPMRNANLTWNAATLDRFLTNPRTTVPGTLMVFPGVRDANNRRDLIAYLAIESRR